MKIKTKDLSFEEAIKLERPQRKKPKKPLKALSALVRILGASDLKKTDFSFTYDEKLKSTEGPFLILMNHSCFLDLEIASRILYPKPYAIVCTSDGFVGKEWLMRGLGCIPTQKFVSDVDLIYDIEYSLRDNATSVLMYPEASYTFDGRATPLPQKLGMLLKRLDVPVMMIRTYGAFLFDPLYNGLRKRNVKVTADVKLLVSRDEIKEKSVEELDAILNMEFTFDNFAWQKENNVEITEDFRATGLERILYKCASCGAEGKMKGEGTHITCSACGKSYEMDTLGRLSAVNGKTEFEHIPDWYEWERQCVAKEIEDGMYLLDIDVDIRLLVDYNAIYNVGEGRLRHDLSGFTLTGCGGKLNYSQRPLSSYGLYSDYFWYELGDMICIGNRDTLYYCFPKKDAAVAKTRLAAEELYKKRSAEIEKKRAERRAKRLSGENDT